MKHTIRGIAYAAALRNRRGLPILTCPKLEKKVPERKLNEEGAKRNYTFGRANSIESKAKGGSHLNFQQFCHNLA